MAVRDEIVWRSAVVYFVIVLLVLALLVRILILQYVQRSKWSAMSEKYIYKTADMPAQRGDILARDGRLLASSVPYYSIYMDTNARDVGRHRSGGIGGLSEGLSRCWRKIPRDGGGNYRGQKRGDRYFLIKES
jgi:cell division protein FtsI (penicillin-binding protein 3)